MSMSENPPCEHFRVSYLESGLTCHLHKVWQCAIFTGMDPSPASQMLIAIPDTWSSLRDAVFLHFTVRTQRVLAKSHKSLAFDASCWFEVDSHEQFEGQENYEFTVLGKLKSGQM